MSMTVKEMMKACERLVAEGHGDCPLYTMKGSSGETGEACSPYVTMNSDGKFDIGPLCEEFIGERVAIISVD